MQFPTMAVAGLHRPIIPLVIESARGSRLIVDALVDTGSDITLFPESVADSLDIGLTGIPEKRLFSALGMAATYRESNVTLELRRSPSEVMRWTAAVGFLARPMVYSILGTKGFFEVLLLVYNAERRLLDLEPHGDLPG